MKKIKEIIQKYKSKEITTKKKVENLVFFLVMLVFVVIGINYIWFNNPEDTQIDNNSNNNGNINNTTSKSVYTNSITNDNLEERLENILSKVKGVSDVSVLITYSNNTKIMPIYNIEDSQTVTNETDSTGGKRDITEKAYTKQVVFDEKNSTKTVIVETQINPTVSGVIVVANYNNDINIKQQIVSAVATATNISEYKVQVLNGT